MPAGTRDGGAMPGPAPELLQTAADLALGRLAASTGAAVIEATTSTRAQKKPFITRETPSGAGWLRRVLLARCRNASRPVKAEACSVADGPAEPETPTEAQTDQVPREASTLVTRAASLGLAGVVVCLAAFSILGAYRIQTQIARAQHEESLHASYDRALIAIRAEDAAGLEYLLDPSSAHRAGMTEATNVIIDAMNAIEVHGADADAQLSKEVLGVHDQYIAAATRMIAAVTIGDPAEARHIELVEAAPAFDGMRSRIEAAAEARASAALAAFAELQATARWILIESPVVFAVGFGLLFGLWRILEQSHRAARETYREIAQLSKLRSEFVSIVSHEFRTPLTGIQGFSEMMRDEELTPEEMHEYAGDINKDAQRLNRMITEMLDLDRMESGRMTIHPERMDLNAVIADVADRVRPQAPNHTLTLDLQPDLPPFQADRDRMTQVASNLLNNAVKYSPTGGRITMTTRLDGTELRFDVRDEGLGIPEDALEAIFERYSRVDSHATRDIQGTGLGLPIVRQIVQLHGGKVWAESELGRGSVFHVVIPLAGAGAQVEA